MKFSSVTLFAAVASASVIPKDLGQHQNSDGEIKPVKPDVSDLYLNAEQADNRAQWEDIVPELEHVGIAKRAPVPGGDRCSKCKGCCSKEDDYHSEDHHEHNDHHKQHEDEGFEEHYWVEHIDNGHHHSHQGHSHHDQHHHDHHRHHNHHHENHNHHHHRPHFVPHHHHKKHKHSKRAELPEQPATEQPQSQDGKVAMSGGDRKYYFNPVTREKNDYRHHEEFDDEHRCENCHDEHRHNRHDEHSEDVEYYREEISHDHDHHHNHHSHNHFNDHNNRHNRFCRHGHCEHHHHHPHHHHKHHHKKGHKGHKRDADADADADAPATIQGEPANFHLGLTEGQICEYLQGIAYKAHELQKPVEQFQYENVPWLTHNQGPWQYVLNGMRQIEWVLNKLSRDLKATSGFTESEERNLVGCYYTFAGIDSPNGSDGHPFKTLLAKLTERAKLAKHEPYAQKRVYNVLKNLEKAYYNAGEQLSRALQTNKFKSNIVWDYTVSPGIRGHFRAALDAYDVEKQRKAK